MQATEFEKMFQHLQKPMKGAYQKDMKYIYIYISVRKRHITQQKTWASDLKGPVPKRISE